MNLTHMNLIRRAVALTVATAMAALVTVAASACGGATTTTGTTTNGLEKKSPADVLQEAAAALVAAKSVHVVGTSASSVHVDARMQGDSSAGTFTQAGVRFTFTIIGSDGYVKLDQAGLKRIGAPLAVQRHDVGRWLKVTAQHFTGLTLASLAAKMTSYNGPLEPKVRQATLDGRKVVVVSWQDGGNLYVANTGPAYPLRGQFTGQNAGLLAFTDYGAPLHITAPGNAINLSNAG